MDDLDKQLIGFMMRDGSLTTTELVDLIFDGDKKYDRHKFLVTVRYRLQKMVDDDKILFDRRTKKYSLGNCSVHDDSTIVLHNGSGDIEISAGPVICFNFPSGAIQIIFLEQCC